MDADVIGSVPGSLNFVRTYNSNPGTVSTILGARWRTDFGQKLGFDGSANKGTVWAYRPDGKSIKHVLTNGVYLPDADISDRLYVDSTNGGAYRLHLSDQRIERYDASGKLLSITHATGQTESLSYSDGTSGPNGGFVLDASGTATTTVLPAGLLIKVSTINGRALQFGYNAGSRLIKLVDPSGGVIRYTYDAANNLSSVTYPDGKVKTYHYGESQFTSGASLPNALTGITDENGVRYVNYSYDSTGRAIDEVFPAVGTHTNRYQLSFGTNSTTVTDPLGTARTYGFQTILGVVKSTGSSQPGGSGCGPAASALSYDANGNVASQTDFNGVKTTYSYDLSRNLETQRVEASGQPEARTVNTQWHPYWRLPVKVAEPNKITTWVYNGDTDPTSGSVLSCAPAGAVVPSITGGTQPIGVLCKKIEQATTDVSGAAGFGASVSGTPRVWSSTYNGFGQILTADGPRTDVPDITTSTYYDVTDPDLGKRGNLATVTNALGQTTRITAYDLNGNPLSIIEPNGVLTTLSYDLRQRLTSRTVGDETTGYQYDGVGQLTRVSLPDGSHLAYTYDAAHRLTDISDALGNTLHYTLDAMGNRIKEEIKDPQGALAQTRSRVYDALNRLQTLIGSSHE